MKFLAKTFLLMTMMTAALPAAIENVHALGASSTQAILAYTAPSTAACTVEVSESPSFSPLVHDVNPALFASANSDIAGSRSRIFVAGKQQVSTALDGKAYSRALQTATQHFFRITCGGDVATGSFQTKTVPVGSSYPLQMDPQDNSGDVPTPTVPLQDRAASFIDAMTGAKIRQMAIRRDEPMDGSFTDVTAAAGLAWTAPAKASGNDGQYASYSGTAQDRLMLTPSFEEPFYYRPVDFVQIKFKGYSNGADAASRTIQFCLAYSDNPPCPEGAAEIVLPDSDGLVTYNTAETLGTFAGLSEVKYDAFENRNLRLHVWKKAAAGSASIFLDNVQIRWGKSYRNEGTAGGFHDVCSQTADANGWYKCIPGINPSNPSLYAIHGETGEVRFLGHISFLNVSVPDWNTYGGNTCGTFGGGSRLFHPTDPNKIFCGGAGGPGDGSSIGLFQLDATNTPKPNGIPDNTAQMSLIVNLLPAGHRLETLLQEFDPTLPRWSCALDAVQGNYLIGTCRGWQQDSYAYLFAFDMGNGTAINDPSCGTRVAGRCSNSKVGIAAALKLWEKPISRWSGVHSYDQAGNVPLMVIAPKVAYDVSNYGTALYRVQLNGAINDTQTTINVTSSWRTNAAGPGTISTSGTTVRGSGFNGAVTKGDTITVGGQTRTIDFVESDDTLYVLAAFSPDVSNQSWTYTWENMTWGGQTWQPGEPVSARGPHFMQRAVQYDWVLVGNEYMRIEQKVSSTQWVVSRGCTTFVAACSTRGSAHPDGASGEMRMEPTADSSISQFLVWDFLRDPRGNDTNFNDYANGNHAFVTVQMPYGFSGSHHVMRGNVRVMAGYDSTYFPNSITDLNGWLKPGTYPIPSGLAFGGALNPPSGGNTYQSHPSCEHMDVGARSASYEWLWCTDISPFIGTRFGGDAGQAAVRIEGDVWKAAKPPAPNDAGYVGPQRKYYPTFAQCGVKALRDVSGPNSHITGADTYTYCFSEKPGECRNSGDAGGASSAGEVFVNCPGLSVPYCSEGESFQDHTRKDICMLDANAVGNATFELGIRPTENMDVVIREGGRRLRPVGRMFHFPRRMSGFANSKVLPNGQWMFHLGQTSAQGRGDIFLLKHPFMPALDTVNRFTFVQVPVKLQPPAGLGVNNAIIEFGYDQPGHAGDEFRCTTRDEACVAAANNNPYYFAGETYSGVSCSNGCTINVPAIPNKVLYYRWVYRTAANAVISKSSTSAIAIP